MDLIERYLGAVRCNLPAANADDIITELADLIAARVEDREEALGRPLSRDELSQLLREFGHPLAVAAQYREQRALIGPELFPFYWFALKIVLAIALVIEAIQIGGHFVVGDDSLPELLSQAASGMVQTLLYNAALVTLAFAVIERLGLLSRYLEKWKPEDLPDFASLGLPIKLRARRRPWAPLFELAVTAAFLGWWTGLFDFAWMPRDADVVIQGAPIWDALYWPVVALICARLLTSLIALIRPWWKLLRAALIIGCTTGAVATAAVLHHAGRIVIVTGADAAKAGEVQQSLDKALAIAVIVVGVTLVWQCAVELWRLYGEHR